MSSETTASARAHTRGGFAPARGRGYRPDQVDRFLDELSEDRDAAWERAARLTVLANEMEAECAALRRQVEALGPADFATLGPGAQELLQMVEEEAAAVRERAEVEAQYARDAADTARRTLQDEARAAASARLAAAEEQAQRVLDEACGQAAEILGSARSEADSVRGGAAAALDAVRQQAGQDAAAADTEQRGRLQSLEHELAEQQAVVEGRLNGLLADAERRLAEAQRERSAAEDMLRRRQAEADARADQLIEQARLHEERVRREAERVLREHEQHRDEVRAHLAHIRATLAGITGRG
ncbi:DivIVA domain-containing protein [Actinacidiphila guanduensis]|uniref:DivIVA domain-containing protein n=1 Tax=Actinacidiphila guanduensis TaxID=310781 RepID=A0A1H0EZB0_9ACTN|nr:DivIVA domain-containing protein [Actinacidiphila guanduensis]SDN87636.1 DivIVA domain-containing protein [Actinacidiphila guanduensis]